MADTDSGQDVADTVEDSPIGTQMGDGLLEDVSTPAVSNSEESPDNAQDTTARPSDAVAEQQTNNTSTDFDPSAVDLQRIDLESVPESMRGLAQNAQNALRQMQSGFTKSQQELAQEIKALKESQASTNVQQTVADTIKQLSKPDEFAHLTPEQQQAVDTVKNIVSAETQEIRDQITAFQEMQKSVQQLQQAQQLQQLNALQQEVNDARGQYGNDIDNYGTQIKALMSTANPRTGQRFTVKDAYELVSGKLHQQSQNLQAQAQSVAQNAKSSIAGTVPMTNGGIPEGNGSITPEDALAGLKGLGFE